MADQGLVLGRAIKRLRVSGRTWQEIANELGFTNPGVPCMIATGRWQPSDQRVREMVAMLPPELLWNGPAELDSIVLRLLSEHGRLTGRELARLCGTIDRTIRNSIKRLREAGHKINGSMGLPRGYRLEG